MSLLLVLWKNDLESGCHGLIGSVSRCRGLLKGRHFLRFIVTGSTYLHGINQLCKPWTARATLSKTSSSQKCSYNSLLIVSFKVISKITVRSFEFILCWEIFFCKRTHSIQSWIISLDGTISLNNTTNTEINILSVVTEIKKCLFYQTLCAF